MNRTWKFIAVVMAIAMIAPSSALAQKGGGDDSSTSTCEPTPWLVFANGESPSDIGSASRLASKNNEAELLYVTKDRVPQPVQNYIENRFDAKKGGQITAYIVGGEEVVGEKAVRQLHNAASLEIIRLDDKQHKDKYGTNVAVAEVEPPCKVVSQEGTYGK